MAERRMFAKTIIDSDAFLDMPLSAQALYFHLSMRADDDGFINNPKKIQRLIGASDDDCKLLVMKRFIITFESGVIVIKHWKIHNYIQKDRYKPTIYQEEKSQLSEKRNKAYTECIHNVYTTDTQDRVSQEIGKSRDRINYIEPIGSCTAVDLEKILEAWNGLNISPIREIRTGSTRHKLIVKRIKDYGTEAVLEAIGKVKKSAFLQGQSKSGWIITFDWFIKPNNFVKVLEGNYDDRSSTQSTPMSDLAELHNLFSEEENDE
ncbi:MAG: hypothetical protein ACI4F5_06330 [Acutalibacteraceae bacterium]